MRSNSAGTVSPDSNSSVSSGQLTVNITLDISLDVSRCALIIQDMQNDVVMDGGAFAESGSPKHCREQNAIANIARLADVCRANHIPVIHVWFIVEPDVPGVTMNAPLFEGLRDAKAVELAHGVQQLYRALSLSRAISWSPKCA